MIKQVGIAIGWIAGGLGYSLAAFWEGLKEGINQFLKKDLTKKPH